MSAFKLEVCIRDGKLLLSANIPMEVIAVNSLTATDESDEESSCRNHYWREIEDKPVERVSCRDCDERCVPKSPRAEGADRNAENLMKKSYAMELMRQQNMIMFNALREIEQGGLFKNRREMASSALMKVWLASANAQWSEIVQHVFRDDADE